MGSLLSHWDNLDIGAHRMYGLVLIDEIESHLHVKMQKEILPCLTELFPNVQFIVTTHSPFVITSISNAVVFDMETRQAMEDLSAYSYEGIIEYYLSCRKTPSFSYGDIRHTLFPRI